MDYKNPDLMKLAEEFLEKLDKLGAEGVIFSRKEHERLTWISNDIEKILADLITFKQVQ